MTNRDYIMATLAPLGIQEEVIAPALGDIDLGADYVAGDKVVGKALCSALELAMFAPKTKSVSESGFSISYDYADLVKMYRLLCSMYEVTPNEELLAMSGISSITDKTSIW